MFTRIITKKYGNSKFSYGVVASVSVVLIIAMIAILLMGLLPTKVSKIDLSENQIYNLSPVSKKIISNVDKKVNIYLIAKQRELNENILIFLKRYAEESKNIRVDVLDTEKDAAFISKYSKNEPHPNSILIISGENHRFIPYPKLVGYTEKAYLGTFNAYTYYLQNGLIGRISFNDFLENYAPYLGLFDLYCYESKITTAIKFITSDSVSKLYFSLGHDETGFSQDIEERLTTEYFKLLPLFSDKDPIPSDCKTILLMPNKDITENELTKFSNYLSDGGKIILLTQFNTKNKFPNLLKLTESFGLTTEFDKYLCEDSEKYCYENYQGLILPDVTDNNLKNVINGENNRVLLAGCTGITSTQNVPEGITHNPILTTSKNAYIKKDVSKDLAFDKDNDVRGTYFAAVSASNAQNGTVVWFSTNSILEDDYDLYTGFGNKDAFTDILNRTSGNEGRSQIKDAAVPSEILKENKPMTYVFAAVVCIVIPALIITFTVIRIRKKSK